MSPPEEPFVPDDASIYGPDPASERGRRRALRDVLGMTAPQLVVVVVIATALFVFLGGPVWSAARGSFPLRLFASYAIIPFLVLPLVWWNRRWSVERLIAATLVTGAAKFAVTVVFDVLQGLTRHWPP